MLVCTACSECPYDQSRRLQATGKPPAVERRVGFEMPIRRVPFVAHLGAQALKGCARDRLVAGLQSSQRDRSGEIGFGVLHGKFLKIRQGKENRTLIA